MDVSENPNSPSVASENLNSTPGPTPLKPTIENKLSIVTPIRFDQLSNLLDGYDELLKAELVNGFQKGFDIGYRGSPNNDLKIKNLTSTIDNHEIVDTKIKKELQEGRFLGPFTLHIKNSKLTL